MSLRLDWCSLAAAKYAVESWHYSRSMPTPPTVKVGCWEHGKFIGVVVVSRGAVQNIGRPFGLNQTQISEVTRISLASHDAPVSRVLAIAVKMFCKRCPGVKMLVSYADPHQGHIGSIYQASNWTYLGTSQPCNWYIDGSGRLWHPRCVSQKGTVRYYGQTRKAPKTSECIAIRMPGKHKYAMCIHRDVESMIRKMSKPYPKRVRSETSDTPHHNQCGEGGAAPTRTL